MSSRGNKRAGEQPNSPRRSSRPKTQPKRMTRTVPMSSATTTAATTVATSSTPVTRTPVSLRGIQSPAIPTSYLMEDEDEEEQGEIRGTPQEERTPVDYEIPDVSHESTSRGSTTSVPSGTVKSEEYHIPRRPGSTTPVLENPNQLNLRLGEYRDYQKMRGKNLAEMSATARINSWNSFAASYNDNSLAEKLATARARRARDDFYRPHTTTSTTSVNYPVERIVRGRSSTRDDEEYVHSSSRRRRSPSRGHDYDRTYDHSHERDREYPRSSSGAVPTRTLTGEPKPLNKHLHRTVLRTMIKDLLNDPLVITG